MKVQLKDIVLAVPALSKLSAGDLQLRLAYKLKRMITALQKEADFFAEQRQKIFEKYGTAKEDGSFDFSEENEPKAAAELEGLLEMEVMRDASTRRQRRCWSRRRWKLSTFPLRKTCCYLQTTSGC